MHSTYVFHVRQPGIPLLVEGAAGLRSRGRTRRRRRKRKRRRRGEEGTLATPVRSLLPSRRGSRCSRGCFYRLADSAGKYIRILGACARCMPFRSLPLAFSLSLFLLRFSTRCVNSSLSFSLAHAARSRTRRREKRRRERSAEPSGRARERERERE